MSELKRNGLYTLGHLAVGDRFYIFGSPGKMPATVLRVTTRPQKVYIITDGERFEKPISPYKQVVFLRHAQ